MQVSDQCHREIFAFLLSHLHSFSFAKIYIGYFQEVCLRI